MSMKMDSDTDVINLEELKDLVNDLNGLSGDVDDGIERLKEHKSLIEDAFTSFNDVLSKIEQLGMEMSDARELADKSMSDVVDGY